MFKKRLVQLVQEVLGVAIIRNLKSCYLAGDLYEDMLTEHHMKVQIMQKPLQV